MEKRNSQQTLNALFSMMKEAWRDYHFSKNTFYAKSYYKTLTEKHGFGNQSTFSWKHLESFATQAFEPTKQDVERYYEICRHRSVKFLDEKNKVDVESDSKTVDVLEQILEELKAIRETLTDVQGNMANNNLKEKKSIWKILSRDR